MVLCELMEKAPSSFFIMWMALSVLGFVLVLSAAGSVFMAYFVNPTYEKWRYKINPKFPSPALVRLEILQTAKGICAATVAPTLSLYLAQHGWSQAYCGVGDYGWGYLVVSFFVSWVVCDFLEWLYHYVGHASSSMWEVHKHHHLFYNPSPFSVIADEPLDQFMRALPMALLPIVMPMNIDLLFMQFSLLFYIYGIYLHWGYELEWPDAHHPWLNTSFQHFAHHALSIKNKPYHTGFYIQLWDRAAGSIYPEEKCFCSKCARKKGERSLQAWEKVEKVDYSVMMSPSFWLRGSNKKLASS